MLNIGILNDVDKVYFKTVWGINENAFTKRITINDGTSLTVLFVNIKGDINDDKTRHLYRCINFDYYVDFGVRTKQSSIIIYGSFDDMGNILNECIVLKYGKTKKESLHNETQSDSAAIKKKNRASLDSSMSRSISPRNKKRLSYGNDRLVEGKSGKMIYKNLSPGAKREEKYVNDTIASINENYALNGTLCYLPVNYDNDSLSSSSNKRRRNRDGSFMSDSASEVTLSNSSLDTLTPNLGIKKRDKLIFNRDGSINSGSEIVLSSPSTKPLVPNPNLGVKKRDMSLLPPDRVPPKPFEKLESLSESEPFFESMVIKKNGYLTSTKVWETSNLRFLIDLQGEGILSHNFEITGYKREYRKYVKEYVDNIKLDQSTYDDDNRLTSVKTWDTSNLRFAIDKTNGTIITHLFKVSGYEESFADYVKAYIEPDVVI